MKIFADTSNVDEIELLNDFSLIHGVTTNPTLMMKEIKSGNTSHWHEIVKEICNTIQKPVSAEVTSTTVDQMVAEGRILSKLHKHIVVKLPCTPHGIKACDVLANYQGIKVNMTLCFNVAQAVVAANAGASYISPFVGRLDDYSFGTGVELVKNIQEAYMNDEYDTKILAASIRNVEHFNQVAPYADYATCPPKVIWDIFKHKLTVSGLEQFEKDWKIANEDS